MALIHNIGRMFKLHISNISNIRFDNTAQHHIRYVFVISCRFFSVNFSSVKAIYFDVLDTSSVVLSVLFGPFHTHNFPDTIFRSVWHSKRHSNRQRAKDILHIFVFTGAQPNYSLPIFYTRNFITFFLIFYPVIFITLTTLTTHFIHFI